MVGKTISHYRILEHLGSGGMGIVYKAEDTNLKRTVALKFLPHGLETHEPERARFQQEAQAAATLNHPNICTIYDITEAEGQQFIAMEYVEGSTLKEKIPALGSRLSEIINYGIQIGEALQEAHSKGVVHRDIKTENIMVNTKNQVKVMDFGLAKLKGSLKLTKASSTVGTLAYMAPEQIEGGQVDARSDLFSFGVVLYEMLTGHFPFRGEHEAAMVYSIINEEPDPIQKYRTDVPSELLHIINRALEKDPEDRYQSAHDMLIDLRRLKKESTRVIRPVPGAASGVGPATEMPPQPAAPPRRRRAPLWIGAAILLLLVGAAILLFSLRSRSVKLNPSFTQRPLEIPLTAVLYPSLSRDGKWAAFPGRQTAGNWALYFMNVAKRDPRALTDEQYALVDYADISPDASEILYAARLLGRPLSIYLVSSQGGDSRKLADTGQVCKWRPDGQRFGYIRGQYSLDPGRCPSSSGKLEFWTARPDGRDQKLEFVDSASSVDIPVCFDWSPDGEAIAWLRGSPDRHSEIIIRNLRSGTERQITTQNANIDEVTWCTNGQILYSSSKSGNTNIWMISSDGGQPVQVTRGSGPDDGVRVSADCSRMLYLVRQLIAHVWTAGIDGGDMRQVTFDNCNVQDQAFSPDGSQICFCMSSSDMLRNGNPIFVMQSDGTNRRQVTSGDAWYAAPSWSPDGKRMVYSSVQLTEPFDSSRVYIMELSNPGTPKCIGTFLSGTWVDTNTILLGGPKRSSLYSFKEDRITQASEDSTWEFPLPQGRYLLTYDNRKGKSGVWITSRDAGVARRKILDWENAQSSNIMPNLRSILYTRRTGDVWRIWIPEGRQEPLPALFNDAHLIQIRTSYDDRKVTFLKSQSEGKLVLVENLFE